MLDETANESLHKYGCFVEDCDRKCSTPQKRRMHLIDKHMFPKEYDFDVVNDGIDQKSSMLRSGPRRRRTPTVQHGTDINDRTGKRVSTVENISGSLVAGIDSTSVTVQQNDTGAETAATPATRSDLEIDDLTGAMSALKFVPSSVKFGRNKGRGGFSKS
jgi:hypothetical protein